MHSRNNLKVKGENTYLTDAPHFCSEHSGVFMFGLSVLILFIL